MALTKAKLEELIASGDIEFGIYPIGGSGITFAVDIATGRVMVTISEDYTGATFAVNASTGHLEVTAA